MEVETMKWYLRAPLVAAVAGLVVASTASAVTAKADVAPSNSSKPTISGSTNVGSTVTANPGTWKGSTPLNFQYQWQVCGGGGNRCHDISGQTAQTYTLTSGDAGNTLRVHVIASNSSGSGSATSNATRKITTPNANVPANVSAPAISGNTSVGSTLTASPGGWSGATPMTFQYQWEICGNNGGSCHNIGGATGTTYQVRSGDSGNTTRVRVIASNSSGSGSATSAPSSVLSSTPAPAPNGCPKLASGATSVAVTAVASPSRLQIDQFLPSGTILRGVTSFSLRVYVSDTCGQPVSGAAVYGTAVPYHQFSVPAESQTDSSGWVTLTFGRLAGFPATSKQQLLVMFLRARTPGASPLAGISTNRLVSLHVNLHG
jgi:hypothetical protein